MALIFYKNRELTEKITSVADGMELWLPRNTVGGTTTETFYVYNDSNHPVESLTLTSANPNLTFNAQTRIAPRSSAPVQVIWKTDVFEALNSTFTVKAVEVATP